MENFSGFHMVPQFLKVLKEQVGNLISNKTRDLKHIKIVVTGWPKSGTTALFYLIKTSMPPSTVTYFEPQSYDPQKEPRESPILVKYLLPDKPGDPLNPDTAFEHFDKKIFIARDRRDQFISGLLYRAAYQHFFDKSEDMIKEFVCMLEKKESDPSSMSVISLYEFAFRGSGGSPAARIKGGGRCSIDFCKNHKDYFAFKYEDLVDGQLEKLENHLGFSLAVDINVDPTVQRVVRTRQYGNWRNWFTVEDVHFFRPLVKEYFEYFGYDQNDWEISFSPKIPPEHCSLYVKRVLDEKRSEVGLARLFEEQQKSA